MTVSGTEVGGTFCLWGGSDLRSVHPLDEPIVNDAFINEVVAISPDGLTVATTSIPFDGSGTVRLWTSATTTHHIHSPIYKAEA